MISANSSVVAELTKDCELHVVGFALPHILLHLLFLFCFILWWITQQKKISTFSKPLSEWKIFLALCCFRYATTFLNQSSTYPDDYWQSLEPAHYFVFKYGYLPSEWTNEWRMRSFLPILPYMLIYKILHIYNLDQSTLFTILPKLFSTIFTCLIDFYTFKLSKSFFGNISAYWSLLLTATFGEYMIFNGHFFINPTEALLNLIGVFYWPWSIIGPIKGKPTSITLSLIVGFTACLVRPSSAAIWLILGLTELVGSKDKIRLLFKQVVPIGILVTLSMIVIDSYFFGKLTFSTYNFVDYNIIQGLSKNHGISPPWFYILRMTLMLSLSYSLLPFLTNGRAFWLGTLPLAYLVEISVVEHKEIRFAYPTYPLLLCLSSIGIPIALEWSLRPFPMIKKFKRLQDWYSRLHLPTARTLFIFVLSMSIAMDVFRGTMTTMGRNPSNPRGVETLMKLHRDTKADGIGYVTKILNHPWFSIHHINVPYLHCGDIQNPDRTTDGPFESPFINLIARWSPEPSDLDQVPWPTYIFANETVAYDIPFNTLVTSRGYRECARIRCKPYKLVKRYCDNTVIFCPQS